MTLFVTFILIGLTLGVGAMLAPAIPSKQPRIAASGILSLATVTSGAVFLGSLLGWDTLVIDYLWFGLITSIFLGGTLTIGMRRTETGENAGWPSFRTLAVVLAWFVILLFWLNNVELKDNALIQNAVILQTTHDLANLQNNPLPPVLLAYFETQLPVEMSAVWHGMLIVLHIIVAWLLYDLGCEISDQAWLGGLGFGLGILNALLFSTMLITVLGTSFVLGFWLFSLRWSRHGLNFDVLAASICGSAAVLTHPITLLFMGATYGVNFFLRQEKSRYWGIGWIALSLLMLIGLSPWLLIA